MNDRHAEVVRDVQAAVSENPVVVVGMAQNPHVKKARQALTDAGISFKYLEYGSYFSDWKPRLANQDVERVADVPAGLRQGRAHRRKHRDAKGALERNAACSARRVEILITLLSPDAISELSRSKKNLARRETWAQPNAVRLAGATSAEMEQEGRKVGRFEDGSADVIGAMIEVHRCLGPGLLESAYEACLCAELSERRIPRSSRWFTSAHCGASKKLPIFRPSCEIAVSALTERHWGSAEQVAQLIHEAFADWRHLFTELSRSSRRARADAR